MSLPMVTSQGRGKAHRLPAAQCNRPMSIESIEIQHQELPSE